ncbi:MAG: deoxyribose-phosphate aldolase [Bacilli bacterium]|nr:deoxyribose-phosphate aldolase [Bacilli bacterium]
MEINKYIDHTNLKAYATKEDIERLCDEAIKHQFASVCVNPYYVSLANELLSRSNIAVCTVIGFPLGQNTISVKEFEAINAVQEGADEIDMVVNIAAIKDGNYNYVKEEIETIRDSIEGKTLKVIIETCYLTKEEIIKMTEICNETFVNFIKTSTGFGSSGAKIDDVALMNEHKMDFLEIKASGGIKNFEDACKFIEAGATRIGTSSGITILEEANLKKNCQCDECNEN